MKLNISKKINLTEDTNNISPLYVQNLMLGQEPNDDLIQYYIGVKNSMQEDKKAPSKKGNYDNLKWGSKKRRLTARPVIKIGIKTFPSYGAIGFFKLKYGARTYILAPINNNSVSFDAPILTMLNKGTELQFTIQNPQNITYNCFRIVLRNNNFAYEYITYENELTVPIPEVKGHYEIFCIGYINEGEKTSFESNLILLEVTEGKDTFAVSD